MLRQIYVLSNTVGVADAPCVLLAHVIESLAPVEIVIPRGAIDSYLSTYLPICLPIDRSIDRSIYLSICISIYRSIDLPVYLFIHVSIHPYICI